MGFAVWIDESEKTVWAQGTHEYRPMGTAVIARNGQVRERDFKLRRRCLSRQDRRYVGLFGSLVDVNSFLKRQAMPGARRRPPDQHTRHI